MNGVMRKLAARKTASVSLTLVLASAGLMGLGVTGAGLAGTAAAAAVPAHASKSAVVVKERTHAPFGKILYTNTAHGRALYYLPSGSCTGGCLSVWPPLKMPKGKTMPKGAGCLRTVKFGHRLQVTYNRHRLYTFVDDSGSSVTGNGVAGFKVAKVVRCR